jgi:Leucine-rich repeat (LRR) protein
MHHNPTKKLKLIRDPMERRVIQSLMQIIENNFGFDYIIKDGHVVEIQMVSTGLAVIPRQFQDFEHLYKVQLPSNKIKRLRNIESLPKTTIFNLSDNLLTATGIKNFSECPHITALDLSMNSIESMSPFRGMANLESLDLSNNYIAEIPAISLPKLKYLDLSQNPIEALRNLHLFPALLDLKVNPKNLPEVEQELIKNRNIKEIQQYCHNLAN